MLIINKIKPFYLNKKDKIIRMGNFKNDGKELNFEDDSLIYMFKKLEKPIEREKLVDEIWNKYRISKSDMDNALNYLIKENFIINYDNYKNIIADNLYSRQNLFFNSLSNEFIKYDKIFKDKKVLILGLGGIGANVALILKRAGFCNLMLVDYDKVEESNLIRQIPYTFKDIGKYKTSCLKEKLDDNKIFSKNIKILSEKDIEFELKNSDFVLCTIDKPQRIIRRLVNRLCVRFEKPVLFCGFSEHVAMVGPFVIPKKTACLGCIKIENNDQPFNNVEIVPSYGPLCILVSSIASNEIINYFANYNSCSLIGKTFMFNITNYESKIITWNKNLNCKECKNNASK